MRKSNLNFLLLSMLLLVAVSNPAGYAQTGTLTTVQASPTGPWFAVDGTTFFGPTSAFWPVGSVHNLSIPQGVGISYNLDFTIQWQFQNWQWTGGGTSASPNIQVIGNIGSTVFTAVFSQQFLLTTQTICQPGPCTGVPGAIMIDGNLVSSPTSWQSPGTGINLFPVTNPGWIFAGWQVNNGAVYPFQPYTVSVTGPTTVTAIFIPAKSVNFVANPANLQIYADGTLMNTPNTLQWGLGTKHTVSALTKQNDNAGKTWVFGSWSDGGAQTHTYVVGNNLNPETITATYVAAEYASFYTSPSNLTLVVDGQTLPPPYDYVWGVLQTHTLAAVTPQTDAQGNTWVFQSWDDGVTTPSRTVTMPPAANVNAYLRVALFTQQSKLTVNSTVAGQVVAVNGSSCTTPCNLTFNAGAQVHASAPGTVLLGAGSRQNFQGWSTGGGTPVAGDWVGALNTANTSITANYQLMNILTASASPTRGGTWRVSPISSDGFYDSQTKVSIAATPRPGYRFRGWSGDLSGSEPTATLNMNVPHNVMAEFTVIPLISRGGVSNGAGQGPAMGVAPGSVTSIFGDGLAAGTAVGPSSPLARILSDITVESGARQMPLYFVSPTQINFQIPPDLAPGPRTLIVKSPGMPDVSSDFEIVRNAPGLFPAVIDGQTYAMVMHQDGTPVTAAAPARAGELLTVYGTGFGPTDHVRPEGLPVPAAPSYRILDPVTVQVGGSVFTPESATAAPGRIGIDMIQFRLDSSAPSGAAIPFYLTVNGVSSNTLPLPIQ